MKAFYWFESAQVTNCTGLRVSTRGRSIVMAALYEVWLDCHRPEHPAMDFGNFFAASVRITPNGPKTVTEVLEAHGSICAQATTDPYGEDPQKYSLSPLCRAITVMIDSYDITPGSCTDPDDGLVSLRKVANMQTVLIARTGVEHGLSAPISFEELRCHALELKRPDIDPAIDVVRVTLAEAVRFVLI